jgi:hypothetical protein
MTSDKEPGAGEIVDAGADRVRREAPRSAEGAAETSAVGARAYSDASPSERIR